MFGNSVFSEATEHLYPSLLSDPTAIMSTARSSSNRSAPRPPQSNPSVREDPPRRALGFEDLVENWRRNIRGREARDIRRYRHKEDDPFCTDQSFFRSGRYRPTAYAPRDRDLAPNVVPRRELNRGPYTGAARCEGPKVFRKYGNNTRERVLAFRRYNHMHESGFDGDVVGSESLPSLINPNAALGQRGSEAVLRAAGLDGALGPGKPGSKHLLLGGSA